MVRMLVTMMARMMEHSAYATDVESVAEWLTGGLRCTGSIVCSHEAQEKSPVVGLLAARQHALQSVASLFPQQLEPSTLVQLFDGAQVPR